MKCSRHGNLKNFINAKLYQKVIWYEVHHGGSTPNCGRNGKITSRVVAWKYVTNLVREVFRIHRWISFNAIATEKSLTTEMVIDKVLERSWT